MSEPRTPSTIVMMTPMFCLPGMTSRANPPMIRPAMTAEMIVQNIAAPSFAVSSDAVILLSVTSNPRRSAAAAPTGEIDADS